MQVEIEQRFEGATVREVEQLYMLDDEFNRTTFELIGYGRKVISCTQQGDLLDRVLHLCPQSGLPPPFAQLVPSGVFHIVEELHYDFGRHRGTWRTSPSVLARQFTASGELALEQTPEGVIFRLHGEARAQLSLLSKRAERQAVTTAHAQHAALGRAIRARLDGSRRVTSYHVISA